MADNTGQRNSPENKPGRELLRMLATASTVGINLVLSTFIGFALGYYLVDRYLNTYPWFTIIFLLLGIAAGFKHLFKIAFKEDSSADSEKNK